MDRFSRTIDNFMREVMPLVFMLLTILFGALWLTEVEKEYVDDSIILVDTLQANAGARCHCGRNH